MQQEPLTVAYVISNVIAVFIVIAAMLWPTIARILLAMIFIGASFTNFFGALEFPVLYLNYGKLTTNVLYQHIIEGPFKEHIEGCILFIAISQLLIGVFTAYKGRLMKIAMIGGILFLLSIAPLGVGSAFPSTLLMAMAYIILLRKKIKFDLYEILVEGHSRYSKGVKRYQYR